MPDTQLRIPWGQIVTIIIVAGVLGILRNTVFSGGVSFQEKPGAAQTTIAQNDTTPVEIDLHTGYKLYQQKVQFLDARSPEQYNESHIPDAINVPAAASFDEKMKAIGALDPEKEYVVYCNNSDCPLAEDLYQFLQVAGFTHLHVMYEGFDGWHDKAYPVTGTGVRGDTNE